MTKWKWNPLLKGAAGFVKWLRSNINFLKGKYVFHVLLGLVTLFAIVALFPHEQSYEFADIKEGEIYVGEQIVAPFTFSINKTPEEYDHDVETAKKSVTPIFVRSDSVSEKSLAEISLLLAQIDTALQTLTVDSVKKNQLKEILKSKNIIASQEILNFLESRPLQPSRSKRQQTPVRLTFKEFADALNQIARDIYSIGILSVAADELPNKPEKVAISNGNDIIVESISEFHNTSELNSAILQKLREHFQDEAAVKAGYEILSVLIKPSLIYDEKQTEERIREAVAKVPLAKGTVLQNEKILDTHERIGKEDIQKLRSLAMAKAEREVAASRWSKVLPFIGRILMVMVGLSFTVIFLFQGRKAIFDDPKKLLMIAISIYLVLILAHFIMKFSLSEYLIPVAIGAMLLTIFFDTHVAFAGTVSMALLLAGLRGNEFSISMITLVVGLASILSVRKVRSRSWLFKSILWVSAGYVISIGLLEMLRYSHIADVANNLAYGIANGFFTPILTYGLMVIFEYAFDMTTDATLLELSDLNKPLLRELAMRAPGTYHHSIIVGSLTEAAAEAIGANSLLARVGAYYHDIGKMEKAEYFVENQKGGKNPHEKLLPSMSCLILVSHVKRGLEIAQEYGLPKEIQAFIAEHHGTTLISYFYNKALEKATDNEEVNEMEFRYPGPKPQSKETGILMLADAVEAASRTLKEPSVSRLRGMANAIIDDRFKTCELDESPLTLRDLTQIKESFVKLLAGIHHGRIEYPDQDKKFEGAKPVEAVHSKTEEKAVASENGSNPQSKPVQKH